MLCLFLVFFICILCFVSSFFFTTDSNLCNVNFIIIIIIHLLLFILMSNYFTLYPLDISPVASKKKKKKERNTSFK